MLRRVGLAVLIAISASASAATANAGAACVVSDGDRVWIDRALQAWRYTSREIAGIGDVPKFRAVFFDAACTLMSPDALNVGNLRDAKWVAERHEGQVRLPNGQTIGAGVTSYITGDDDGAIFIMATPSVWRAAGVNNEVIGLETMMVAVLIHEASHVAQSATYGAQVDALVKKHKLPESFNDDSLQARFKDDAAFAASVAREIDLFLLAASAPDIAAARKFAREARDLMRTRAARSYTGSESYWAEAEDLWLTFEGAGQWTGYQWVVNPRGANVSTDVALPNFVRRSRWWSQNEGLALFLALDRIAGADWKRHAYGDGAQTALQMLDAALARQAP
jgi:hypothetical protein